MAPFKAALLVVDFQEDFCPPNGALAVPHGRDIAPVINTLLSHPSFALRIATQDWHPSTHISFASNHPPPHNQPFTSKHTFSNPSNASESSTITLWPPHCVQHTSGASLIPELDTSNLDHVIKKGQDPALEMLSAFRPPFRSPSVGESDLAKVLKENDITDVFVTGLAADFCVLHTALDAKEEGFEIWVVKDATRGIGGSEDGVKRWEEALEEKGIKVVDAEEVGRRVG